MWQNRSIEEILQEERKLKKIVLALILVLFSVSGHLVSAQPHGFELAPLRFTPEEQAWIDNHRNLKMAVEKDAPPYEYLDGKIFKGITSSYIHIIEQSIGIRFEPVEIDDLPEGFRLLEEGKVAIVPMANRLPGEKVPALFSQPYVSSSLGIFGNANTAFINSFDDILEQKMAVSSHTLAKMPLLLNARKHNFVTYDHVIEAIKAVNDGEMPFYVGDILHTKFAMEMFGFADMRYIAPVVGSAYSFQMAVSPDNEMLLRLIDRAMAEISPIQHFEIRQKWTSDYFGREQLEVQRYLHYLYLSFGIFALILAWFFYRSHLSKKKALQIAHTQKMESIGRLAGGVAHDFNNMLAGIHGAAEILEMKIDTSSPLKKYTNIIINACERSSYLTSQLLVFSRDKGQKAADINLHTCLKDAIALLEHGVNKKIEIKEDFQAQDYYISGNRNLIQSLILNLGFNAKDAMGDKGEIDISTRDVDLGAEDIADCVINTKPGRYIEVCVKDYGCGIPENIRPKIFEPFFTTKEIGKGTGLGLAAVYGIVLEHKGTIRVESSSEGTSFYLYFPLIANKAEPKSEAKPAESVTAKVLVVDDEKILLELMKDILITLGAEVITVNDALQAVDVYKQNPDIDVVMLDVIMPGKTGVEIYDELLKINPDIRVIFMSGYNKDNEVLGLVEKNANAAFINKPYAVADCQQKITNMLAKK